MGCLMKGRGLRHVHVHIRIIDDGFEGADVPGDASYFCFIRVYWGLFSNQPSRRWEA